MNLLLIGLNHAVAGIDVREQAAIPPDELPTALRLLAARSELSGVLVLSTCSRTEVYATGRHLAAASQAVRASLKQLHPEGYPAYAAHLYRKADTDAASHLFRVAAGVDSLLVGESQVLGQVRAAVGQARRHGRLDPLLAGTADRAVSAARRARRTTGIGRGAVSVGHAAARCTKEALGTVAGVTVLVVGAGEVGDLAVRMLRKGGARVQVASRTGVSAAAVAARYGGESVDLAALPRLLKDVDVLVCSASGPSRLVTRQMLGPALTGRRRPLVVLDLGVPRNVEPEAVGLGGIVYLDVDALSRRAAASLEGRQAAMSGAIRVLDQELAEWQAWRRATTSGPILAGIAAYADEIRVRELERSKRGLQGLDPLVDRRMEALSRALVSKLLLHPVSYLRSNPEDRDAAEVLERIFRDRSSGSTGEPSVTS